MQNTQIPQQQPAEGRELPIPVQLNPAYLTPVYGTAQPTTGALERLRRQAYSYAAHDPKRWMTLLAADRMERSAELTREAIIPGQQPMVLRHFARLVRAHPKESGAAVAAALAGALIVAGMRRSS
ncbi:MAG: hypothetical protein M3Q29_03890 [Chloroflexota bacterium]|nr:hypothetical protein [Chloroflexota bacterium]